MGTELLERVKQRLQEPLPGVDAQYLMAPEGRTLVDFVSLKEGSFRPSAVLVLFCRDKSGKWFIPLIERSSYDGYHAGQIGLPGGKPDELDRSLEETALRECAEEIGLKEKVEVVGSLTPLYIPVSGFLVHPFIAELKVADPVLVPHEREVQSIVRLEIDRLMQDSLVSKGEITVRETVLTCPYFEVGPYRVWGATAMILSELKQVIASVY